MRIRSPGFTKDGYIPSKFTCEGEDISPPISWDELPDGTETLALLVIDPDSPDPARPQKPWIHWVVYNIPPEARRIPEGANLRGLPHGALEGLNDWSQPGWRGPCPSIGAHRYVFKLFALDITLPKIEVTTTDSSYPTKSDLEIAMHQHILGEAEITGIYKKRHTSRRAG